MKFIEARKLFYGNESGFRRLSGITLESGSVYNLYDRDGRSKMKLTDVVAEIKRVSGTQLSPRVVEAFLQLVDEGVISEDMPVEENIDASL